MATVQGVYSASVVDNRDPERLGRVRVAVPAAGLRGVWARVATATPGLPRGAGFIPEVGDEVLVAFEGGDPQVPYVIGYLRSARKVTTLVIETAGGQRITLQDSPGAVRVDDQNGNSVILEAAGVTVASSVRVTVQASVIEVSAGQLTVNAGMSRFSGTLQCDTMISNSVISASYSPGAGNIW